MSFVNEDKLDRVSGFVGDLVDFVQQVGDPSFMTITVTDLKVAMPVELYVETDGSSDVALAVAPPRQRTKTSIAPTLHSMRMRVALNDGREQR